MQISMMDTLNFLCVKIGSAIFIFTHSWSILILRTTKSIAYFSYSVSWAKTFLISYVILLKNCSCSGPGPIFQVHLPGIHFFSPDHLMKLAIFFSATNWQNLWFFPWPTMKIANFLCVCLTKFTIFSPRSFAEIHVSFLRSFAEIRSSFLQMSAEIRHSFLRSFPEIRNSFLKSFAKIRNFFLRSFVKICYFIFQSFLEIRY